MFVSLNSSGLCIVVSATHFIPACKADSVPFGESSNTKQSAGSTLRSRAHFRKVSGSGLLFVTSSALRSHQNTYAGTTHPTQSLH